MSAHYPMAGLAALFVACVYGANWTLDRYGMVELPLIAWMAPAGVFWAGLSFGVRDALHEAGGRRWVLGAIAAGTGLSWWLTDAVTVPGGRVSLAVASGAAFALSELADLAVYEPLRRRQWTVAVVASNLVGAVVDSVLFLWLAFGAVDAVGGQVIGKAVMILPALPVVWGVRLAVPRHRQYAGGA